MIVSGDLDEISIKKFRKTVDAITRHVALILTDSGLDLSLDISAYAVSLALYIKLVLSKAHKADKDVFHEIEKKVFEFTLPAALNREIMNESIKLGGEPSAETVDKVFNELMSNINEKNKNLN